MRAILTALAFVLACDVIFAPPAMAYLDPGTGTMIVQAVLGVVLGISFTAKMWWHRVIGFFRRKTAA